jgi:predicted ATPase
VEALQVPATVQTILAARIDRLPPEEKRLLQAASVIGKDVPYALLAVIAEQPEEALRRGLGHLQEAEFLYETQLFPDLEFTFKHALTHDVAYAGLLGERRRDLHAAVAAAIERLHADRLVEHVERLAHHAWQGEVWDTAVRYLRQAGTKVFLRSAHREAAAYFEQALDRVEVGTAEAHYRQALALAEELGLRPLMAHCQLGLGVLSRRAGTRQQAREHLTTAGTMFGEMDMRYWREQAEMAITELA